MAQAQVPFGRRVTGGVGTAPSWPSPPVERLEIFERRPAAATISTDIRTIPAADEPDPVKAELERWKRERKARRTTDLGVWRWIGVAAIVGGAAAPFALRGPIGDGIGLVLGPTGVGLMLKGVRWYRSRPIKDVAET